MAALPIEKLLTALEIKVVEQLLTGATNKEIARTLELSPFTVREYVQRLTTKLKCRNRVEIVVALIGQNHPYTNRVDAEEGQGIA